jgi:hypothetical protein
MFLAIQAEIVRCITQIEFQINISHRDEPVMKLHMLTMDLPVEFDILPE